MWEENDSHLYWWMNEIAAFNDFILAEINSTSIDKLEE